MLALTKGSEIIAKAVTVTAFAITGMSMKFYNRQTEIGELRAVSRQVHTSGGLMSVIVGRLRIGKTRLLRQAYQDTANYLYLFVAKKPEPC